MGIRHAAAVYHAPPPVPEPGRGRWQAGPGVRPNVVISTAYRDSGLMAEALRAGRFSLLPKPFGPDQLGLTPDAVAARPHLIEERRSKSAP